MMKKGAKGNTQFHGILAVGGTREEATNRYRLLALGKGAVAKVDAGRSLAFVTTAGANMPELFNPRTGELDLKSSPRVLSGLSFSTTASGDVTVNHYECTAGCSQHLVYDSDALLKFCPVCTTAVTASDEDGEAEDWDGADAEDGTDDDDSATASDDGEDGEEDDGEEDDEDGDEDLDLDDEDGDEDGDEDDSATASDGDDEDGDDEDGDDEDLDLDDEDGDDEDDSAEASDQPLVVAAASKEEAVALFQKHHEGTATASADVDYMVCSSAECGAHVMSEDPSVSACPSCKSDLQEPETSGDEQRTGIVRVHASDDGDGDEDDDLSVVDDDDDSDDDDEDDDEDDSAEASAATANPLRARRIVESTDMEQIDVDMLAQIDDSTTDAYKALDVSFSSAIAARPQWTAFYAGQPVATARAEDVGANKDLFAEAGFGHAVIAGAKHVGVKAVLTEMGFKPVVCSVLVPSLINEKVEQQVATASATLEDDKVQYGERLMSALATAAIGINRGFFTQVENPVKKALWSAMSAAGIKNPEALLDTAFRNSSDEYHRTLFAQASDIMTKPAEVQEGLAKAVLGMSYQGTAQASDSAGAGDLEGRLENFGTAVASATPAQPVYAASPGVATASSDHNVTSVVAGLGRRRV